MNQVNLSKPARRAPAKRAAAKKIVPKPFASVEAIKLGMVAREPATGMIGTLIYKAELISGSVQYAVQPQGDGKSLPEGHFYDDFLLEYVSDGLSAEVPSVDPSARFRLGEELEDTITGLKGIAIERTTYLNGCVHYTLQTRKPARWKFWKKPDGFSDRFDYKRLRKIADGVAGPAPKPVALKAAPEPKPAPANFDTGFRRSPTGGPSRSLQGYR